jgi:hypothetical protein
MWPLQKGNINKVIPEWKNSQYNYETRTNDCQGQVCEKKRTTCKVFVDFTSISMSDPEFHVNLLSICVSDPEFQSISVHF